VLLDQLVLAEVQPDKSPPGRVAHSSVDSSELAGTCRHSNRSVRTCGGRHIGVGVVATNLPINVCEAVSSGIALGVQLAVRCGHERLALTIYRGSHLADG
jgi:hypothetical protein